MTFLTKICIQCKKIFSFTPNGKKYNDGRKFCSYNCYWESLKGIILPNINNKERIPWNKNLKGIHLSPHSEFKKGIHASPKTEIKKGQRGKESIAYKEPEDRITPLRLQIRNSSKYSDWRTQIFGRDNFTCQKCGVRGSWLEAHHVKEFAQIFQKYNIISFEGAMNCIPLWDVNNGITLCEKCHGMIHFKKGEYADV